MSKAKKVSIVFLLGIFTVLGYFLPTLLSNYTDYQNSVSRTEMQFSTLDLTGRNITNIIDKMDLIQQVTYPVTLDTEKYLTDEYCETVVEEINTLLSDLEIPIYTSDQMITKADFVYYLDILDSSKAILAWNFSILNSEKDIYISVTVDDSNGQILSIFVNDISGSLNMTISGQDFDRIVQSYMEYLSITEYSVSGNGKTVYYDTSVVDRLNNSKDFEIRISKDSHVCTINASYSDNGFCINYSE